MPDTIEYIILAQQGDADAEQAAVIGNLALVHSICKRFINRGVEYDDLVQLGSIGLLKAVRRFDPSYGVCFSTYAVPLIAGEIKRFLRDDGMVKSSRSFKQLAMQVRIASSQQEEITVEQLAQQFNVSSEDIAIALCLGSPILSLDATLGEEGSTLTEYYGTASFEGESANRLYTEELLDGLSPRERILIEMRFFHGKTQTEVASRLGMSQVQVSRLERKVLSQLKQKAT